LGALERAGELGALRVSLACVPGSMLASLADVALEVDTGPEAISGSTRLKAGTAQKLVLNAFSTTLMVRLGKVYGNLMVDVRATNAKLRRRAARLVSEAAQVSSEDAEAALTNTDGDVKAAIATLRLGVIPEEAARRLQAANGRLRRVLG